MNFLMKRLFGLSVYSKRAAGYTSMLLSQQDFLTLFFFWQVQARDLSVQRRDIGVGRRNQQHSLQLSGLAHF